MEIVCKLKHIDHELFITEDNEYFKRYNHLYLVLTNIKSYEDLMFYLNRGEFSGVMNIQNNKLAIRVDVDKGKTSLFYIEYEIIGGMNIWF